MYNMKVRINVIPKCHRSNKKNLGDSTVAHSLNLKLYLPSNFNIESQSILMLRPSPLRFSHRFSIEFQSKVSCGSQLHNIFHPQRSREFSSSTTSQRFKLQLSKTQQPKMAPEMTTLKGRPLDRTAVDSLLRRRFFYAPSADIYG